jgi:hypothetical protein
MVLVSREDERGSITPLIIFYFSIILALIFLIANVASVYIARRDLISRSESALSIAVQELDEIRYYYGSPLTDFLADDAISSRELRVPIDCGDASRIFTQSLFSISSIGASALPYEPLPYEPLPYEPLPYEPLNKVSATSQPTSKLLPRHQISIESIQCDGFDLSAKLSERHELPFQLRVFGLTHYINKVEVGTASFLLSNED